jgi:sugar phosphate isomerase/epimerase
MTSRRTFLATALAAPVFASNFKKDALKLGVASYSLRNLSRADAIAAIVKLETQYVSIKEFHLRYKSTPEELAAGVKEFKDAGLTILSGGNIDLKGDDATLKAMFEYAKMATMPMMVCAPSHDTLGKVEALARQYNMKMAIHNHGPEDKHFPSPQSVLDAVKGMDKRMGLCIDIGHTVRTGADVVESIDTALRAGRLYDLHIKDLADLTNARSQVAVGEGKMPIKQVFQVLKKHNYQGGVMLEYEINANDPVPGMVKSFEHMRKVLGEIA